MSLNRHGFTLQHDRLAVILASPPSLVLLPPCLFAPSYKQSHCPCIAIFTQKRWPGSALRQICSYTSNPVGHAEPCAAHQRPLNYCFSQPEKHLACLRRAFFPFYFLFLCLQLCFSVSVATTQTHAPKTLKSDIFPCARCFFSVKSRSWISLTSVWNASVTSRFILLRKIYAHTLKAMRLTSAQIFKTLKVNTKLL